MDATSTPASAWAKILRRGFWKRCGRCGSGKLFDGWFRLKDHCPRCGMRFEREEGAFTGVYLLNFGLSLFLLWAVMMVYVAMRAMSDGPVDATGIVVAAVLVSVVVPIAFYPYAKTIWIAMHLAADPLSDEELAEADEHRGAPAEALDLATR